MVMVHPDYQYDPRLLPEIIRPVIDERAVAQIVAAGFRIAEVLVPVRYFPEASSESFLDSVGYGVRILELLAPFAAFRAGFCRSRNFESLRARYRRLKEQP